MPSSSQLLRKFLTLVSVGFAASSAAFALTWTDVSTFSPQYLYAGSNPANSTRTGLFDLTDGVGGYDPALHSITSAYATFAFADDSGSDASEYVTIKLGTPYANFISGQEVNGTHPAVNFAWYGANVTGTLLADLSADGRLNWKVQVTSGDTYLKVAKLIAEGTTRSVPDHGPTLTLFALGLLGLAAARRRTF